MTRSIRLAVALAAGVGVLALMPGGSAARLATCDCSRVSAVATGVSTVANPNVPVAFSLTLKTTLKCTRGVGKGCSGELIVQPALKTPPPITTDAQLVTPASPTIRCTGRCLATTTRTVRLEFHSANDLKFSERENETWLFRLRPVCNRATGKVTGTTIRISVVFGSDGGLDSSKSDLNANGIPDGQE